MNHLKRSLLVTALLGCAVTASASHHQGQHWAIGFQGAFGWASVDSQATYQESDDADDFYSDYESDRNSNTYEDNLGLYGVHVARVWDYNDSSLELEFAANIGSGTIENEQLTDEPSGDATLYEATKPKNQFNLEFKWKHFIDSSSTYFLLGAGISQATIDNTFEAHANELANPKLYDIAHHQVIHPLGAIVSMGMGYDISATASFDVGFNYAVYHTKKLNDTVQLDSSDGDDSPDYVRHRRTQLSLFTLTAGYSYHF